MGWSAAAHLPRMLACLVATCASLIHNPPFAASRPSACLGASTLTIAPRGQTPAGVAPGREASR